MTRPFSARRSRAILGIGFVLLASGVTVLRIRAIDGPLEMLETVTRLHREGRASDALLANASYHAGHARLAHEQRWSLARYATHGLLGVGLGLALVFVRRREGSTTDGPAGRS